MASLLSRPHPELIAVDPSQSPKYQPLFDKQASGLKVLEIHGQNSEIGAQDRLVEFSVVMRVGLDELLTMTAMPQVTANRIGVTMQTNGRKVQVVFDRSDICGGEIIIANGVQTLRYRLRGASQ